MQMTMTDQTFTFPLRKGTSISATSVDAIIQQRITSARQEARNLYTEIEFLKDRIKDTTLAEASQNIDMISNHSINPRMYNNLEGHQTKIAKIDWLSDSNQILSASQDGFMILWDAVTGYKKHIVELENQWVLTCSVSPKGNLIASGGLDNCLTIYNIDGNNNGRPSQREQMSNHFGNSSKSVFKGHRAYISDCKFLNNDAVLSSSGDMTCALWDVQKNTRVCQFVEHTGDILCMDTFSGNSFISGSCDGYCKIWDIRTKKPVQNLFVSNYDINTIKVFPEGKSFISGSDDGNIRMFDLRSDCEMANYSIMNELKKMNNNNTSSVNSINRNSLTSMSSLDSVNLLSVDFSKSGRLIYACYNDFGCLIWDTLKEQLVGSIGGHLNKINQIKVSGDGIGIATALWDSTIKVWSV